MAAPVSTVNPFAALENGGEAGGDSSSADALHAARSSATAAPKRAPSNRFKPNSVRKARGCSFVCTHFVYAFRILGALTGLCMSALAVFGFSMAEKLVRAADS
jgi:hypothetical protein